MLLALSPLPSIKFIYTQVFYSAGQQYNLDVILIKVQGNMMIELKTLLAARILISVFDDISLAVLCVLCIIGSAGSGQSTSNWTEE